MSLFGSVGKIFKAVAPKLLGAVNPYLGMAASALTSVSKGAVRAGVPASVVRNLPKLAGGAMAGYALPSMPGGGQRAVPTMDLNSYQVSGDIAHMHRRRRRRKGITAKDLTSFKRVARLVDKYAKPVHHFRNIKK